MAWPKAKLYLLSGRPSCVASQTQRHKKETKRKREREKRIKPVSFYGLSQKVYGLSVMNMLTKCAI